MEFKMTEQKKEPELEKPDLSNFGNILKPAQANISDEQKNRIVALSKKQTEEIQKNTSTPSDATDNIQQNKKKRGRPSKLDAPKKYNRAPPPLEKSKKPICIRLDQSYLDDLEKIQDIFRRNSSSATIEDLIDLACALNQHEYNALPVIGEYKKHRLTLDIDQKILNQNTHSETKSLLDIIK